MNILSRAGLLPGVGAYSKTKRIETPTTGAFTQPDTLSSSLSSFKAFYKPVFFGNGQPEQEPPISSAAQLLSRFPSPTDQLKDLLKSAEVIQKQLNSPVLTFQHVMIAALTQAEKEVNKDFGHPFFNEQGTFYYNARLPLILESIIDESLFREVADPKTTYNWNQNITVNSFYKQTYLTQKDLLRLLQEYKEELLEAIPALMARLTPEEQQKEARYLEHLLTTVAAKGSGVCTSSLIRELMESDPEKREAFPPLEQFIFKTLQDCQQQAQELSKFSNDLDHLFHKLLKFKKKMPPDTYKNILNELRRAEQSKVPHEVEHIKSWAARALALPWDATPPVQRNKQSAQAILDEDHYGMKPVKDRVLEFLAKMQNNPNGGGKILFLAGPPGIGKTSITTAIAKVLGRQYVRLSVGGIHDSSFVNGHSKTYNGSTYGAILEAMKKAGSTNPVFVLDEAEKIGGDSGNAKTEEVKAALLAVLDPVQQKKFTDHYFQFEYPLDKVLFVLTGNYPEYLPPALKDRLEIIQLDRYDDETKYQIAVKHLLPKIRREYGFTESEFSFTPEALMKIIRQYTPEPGVRGLDRMLDKIAAKVNVSRRFSTHLPNRKTLKEHKPITDWHIHRNAYLGEPLVKPTKLIPKGIPGKANGLSVSDFGGTITPLEVNLYPSTQNGRWPYSVTGSAGDMMKESVEAGLGYIEKLFQQGLLKVAPEYQDAKSIQVQLHLPTIGVKKDGPSGGVTLVTAIISALTGIPVKHDVAMTGEMSLHGDVTEIGGVKEKIHAAYTAGAKTVFIPEDNRRDLKNIPAEERKAVQIIPVSHIEDILKQALESSPFVDSENQVPPVTSFPLPIQYPSMPLPSYPHAHLKG